MKITINFEEAENAEVHYKNRLSEIDAYSDDSYHGLSKSEIEEMAYIEAMGQGGGGSVPPERNTEMIDNQHKVASATAQGIKKSTNMTCTCLTVFLLGLFGFILILIMTLA